MKKLTVILLVLPFFVLSCEAFNQRSELISFTHSGCKNNLAKNTEQETIRLTLTTNNTLSVSHNNVFLNCCNEKLFFDFKKTDKMLLFYEKDGEDYCNCICPYNLEFTISNVLPQKYTILLYRDHLNTAKFSIDFTLVQDTTIALTL